MKKQRYKIGDLVFHHTKHSGAYPAVVEDVNATGQRAKISGAGWVHAHRLQLQSEWKKNNDI